MKTLSHFRSVDVPVEEPGPNDAEKNNNETGLDDLKTTDGKTEENDLQHGVQAAEAMVQVWTTRDLVLAYVL